MDYWDFSNTSVKRTGPTDGKFRLSYSGSSTLLECEQKFVLGRVLHVPADPDSEDSYALTFGSAFHWVCEQTLHLRTPEVPYLAQEAIRLYDLESQDYYKLAACLERYFALHAASGLVVVACEVEIYVPGFYLGYVDAVMVAPDGGWWICDLKTAARAMNTTFRKLRRDPQLNLYAIYKDRVAAIVGLKVENFQGCIYRTTTKPVLVPRKGETVREYVARADKVSSFSIYIRESDLHVEETRVSFEKLFARAAALNAGEVPMKNYNACGNWNRACEYWSQCHGGLFSESNPSHLHETSMRRAAPESIPPETDWEF